MDDSTSQSVAVRAVERLHVLVRRSLDRAIADGRAQSAVGAQQNLRILDHRLRKIRRFSPTGDPGGVPKRIGVFGPPKRGKSTLLNVLLGMNILPTGKVPLTGTTIEMFQQDGLAGWEVTSHLADGEFQPYEFQRLEDVAGMLRQQGAHGGRRPPVKRIEVRAAFADSRLLGRGGVLIDTPGAEVAFERVDQALAEDTQRALDTLRDTHIVLLCLRADELGSRSEHEFYERHLRLLDPLVVIGHKDLYYKTLPAGTPPDQWEGELVTEAVSQYGIPRQRCLPVSAQWAQNPVAPDAAGQDSGIARLEEAVSEEILRLSPVGGFTACFREYERTLANRPDLRPESIYHRQLRHILEEQPAEWNAAARKALAVP